MSDVKFDMFNATDGDVRSQIDRWGSLRRLPAISRAEIEPMPRENCRHQVGASFRSSCFAS